MEWSNFTQLTKLILRHNHITEIPVDLALLPKIEFIELRGNMCTSLPSQLIEKHRNNSNFLLQSSVPDEIIPKLFLSGVEVNKIDYNFLRKK